MDIEGNARAHYSKEGQIAKKANGKMGLVSANSLVAAYAILVGLSMIGMWAALLLTDQVPASEKPWAITFHLIAEFSTAILLIVSGVGLWLHSEWAKRLSLISLGTLLYSVVASPGYYAQKNNLPMVVMFVVFIILTVTAIIALLKFN